MSAGLFAAVAYLLVSFCGIAQEPRVNPGGLAPAAKPPRLPARRGPSRGRARRETVRRQLRRLSREHGARQPGAPDLIRSIAVVLTDEKGILIAPVLRNGRPDQGMPKPNLTEPQIADIVAWLHVQTYAAGHRATYAFQDVVTGDAKKGEAYFNGAGACNTCHSPTGDLKGIGGALRRFALQARWLQPAAAARRPRRPGRQPTAARSP